MRIILFQFAVSYKYFPKSCLTSQFFNRSLLKRLDYLIVFHFGMEHHSNEIQSFYELKSYIGKHCVALESLSANRHVRCSGLNPQSAHNSTFVDINSKPPIFLYSKQNHSYIDIYADFQSKLYFNCLSSSNILNSCKSQSTFCIGSNDFSTHTSNYSIVSTSKIHQY